MLRREKIRKTSIKSMSCVNYYSLSSVDCCQDGIKPYSDLVSGFKQPLEDLKSQSYKKLSTYIRSGQSELSVYIDDFFDGLSSQRDNESQIETQLIAFQTSLTEKYKGVAEKNLGQIFEDIMVGFQNTVKNAYSSSDFVKLPEFKLEQIEEQIPIVRAGTKKRNGLLGTLIGGAIGAVVGGPVGAALGASVGGGLGGATGRSADANYRSISITVGDNLQEIRQQAIRSSEKMFEEHMRKSADSLWASMDQDVERLLSKLRKEITDFESQLLQMLRSTEHA